MNKSFWIKTIAISGLISVALGAFAAHVLDSTLTEGRMSTFQTAVQYQIFHTLALLGIVSIDSSLIAQRLAHKAAYFFLAGIILFSGSLYLLVATDISLFAMVTPIGGVSFMIGWAMLLLSAIREK